MPDGELLARARAIYTARRRRGRYLELELLGEPAWDLLLDLYIAAAENRRIAISSACIAADVPQTTALRWIGRLVARGYVVRSADPGDARRTFLVLTPVALTQLEAYLAETEW